ncbi:MAG: hypothetical protein DRP15_00915 [Candidatus Aenigmatarchaeota archaeon]|nr:MAG: hypothetical protein DRP15_00915 [Candidatus Aenigmarchaeota archaeon]
MSEIEELKKKVKELEEQLLELKAENKALQKYIDLLEKRASVPSFSQQNLQPQQRQMTKKEIEEKLKEIKENVDLGQIVLYCIEKDLIKRGREEVG